jgi:hypothetical protein
MCRGNPDFPRSSPGGTTTETFAVPAGVASVDAVKVAIDPDSSVTAHATLSVNGNPKASAVASGDTSFGFSPVPVRQGDTVTLSISFTATSGQIITVYSSGTPGGTFTTANSCENDANENARTSAAGLKAVVSGWNR